MLRLVATYSNRVHRLVLPPEGELRLGAASDNDLVLPAPGVSRRHARLEVRNRSAVVTDLGSKNGILQDGERRQRLVLRPGGVVQMGSAFVTLEEVSTSDVELALEIETEPQRGRAAGSDRDTDDVMEVVSPARRVLGFVRRVEAIDALSSERRSELLAEARQLLCARAIFVCALDPSGRVVLSESHGALPGGALGPDLEEVVRQAVAAGGLYWTGIEGDRYRVLMSGPMEGGPQQLGALFDPSSERHQAWIEDLFGFLVHKLRSDDPELPLPQTPAPEGGSEEALEVPDAMIEGSSTAMRELMGQLRATVHSTLDVLLLGETGTGKELFARMVHASGPKREGPFVAINCAAIPSELLEAELFGVVGRVATGVDPRPGRFTQAGGGSIFLDEVGELPERLQAKLLRVLQEREVLPIGSSRPRKIDVRVISASNRDLARLVQERGFRADLYYRLRGLEFHIPPLRERREDLPELILTFASRASRKYRKRVQGVSRRALTQLMEYSWPGNVRELETEVERAVLLCPAGGTLESEHFGSIRWEEERQRSGSSGEIAVAAPASLGSSSEGTDAGAQAEPDRRPLKERVDELERAAIAEALATTGGNKTRAAELLGITRNGLSLKMKRLGLEVGRS